MNGKVIRSRDVNNGLPIYRLTLPRIPFCCNQGFSLRGFALKLARCIILANEDGREIIVYAFAGIDAAISIDTLFPM
jgi:hypothetical protein